MDKLSDEQRRMQESLFEAWDSDQNGYIEQKDIENRIQQQASRFGVGLESERYQALRDAFVRKWQRMQETMDTDADQRISRDEYLTYIANNVIGHPEVYADIERPIMEAFVSLVDTDGDGRLSRAEFVKWRSLRKSEAEAADEFQRLDRNNDGYVTRDEILKADEELFLKTV